MAKRLADYAHSVSKPSREETGVTNMHTLKRRSNRTAQPEASKQKKRREGKDMVKPWLMREQFIYTPGELANDNAWEQQRTERPHVSTVW